MHTLTYYLDAHRDLHVSQEAAFMSEKAKFIQMLHIEVGKKHVKRGLFHQLKGFWDPDFDCIWSPLLFL